LEDYDGRQAVDSLFVLTGFLAVGVNDGGGFLRRIPFIDQINRTREGFFQAFDKTVNFVAFVAFVAGGKQRIADNEPVGPVFGDNR